MLPSKIKEGWGLVKIENQNNHKLLITDGSD